MRELIAFILLSAVLVAIALIVSSEHHTARLSMVHTSAPDNWTQEHRLFATCPVTPWALPHSVGEHMT